MGRIVPLVLSIKLRKNVIFPIYSIEFDIYWGSQANLRFCSILFFGQNVDKIVFELLLCLSEVTRQIIVARQELSK